MANKAENKTSKKHVKVITKKIKTEQLMKSVDNEMPKILLIAALDILGEAIDRCPTDTHRLVNSLNYEADDRHAIVGTNVEYAPYVEFGTVKMTAQPYLRPAFDATKLKIMAKFGKGLKGAIVEGVK